ncbi:MAG TPA: LacI family DNA-binding transcriptional regulator [Fimbriimonas sp.]|nr:LacI family DNA-binding transcriptional regulator [Fimbriimonas sp.]
MATTIKDIAQRLNLSISTVSYALNGGPKPVSREVHRRVQNAAREMGYRPNRIAKSLVTRRTRTIGIVPVDLNADLLLTPCEHLTLNGAFNAAAKLGHDVLVFTAHDRNIQDDVIDDMMDGRVDGVVFIGPRRESPALQHIGNGNMPYAILLTDNGVGPSYVVDNERGTLLAMEHLWSLGHRNIAHVTGNFALADANIRRDAYRQFMVSKTGSFDPRLEIGGDYHRESGYEAGRSFPRMPHPPTAFFCANDDMAFGLIEGLRAVGVDVPEQVSVVGFDDAPVAPYFHPPLTTVRQPLALMASEAMLAVIQEIDEAVRAQGRMYEPELIVRNSTAPVQR